MVSLQPRSSSSAWDALVWWLEFFRDAPLIVEPLEPPELGTPHSLGLGEVTRETLPEGLEAFEQLRVTETVKVRELVEALGEGVRGLSRVFHEWLGQERALDRRTAGSLLRVSRGLDSADSLQVRQAVTDLVELVGGLISEREGLREQRLRVLRAHLSRMEQQLTVQLGPYALDSETGLPKGAALREQLEFLSSVGALTEHPPTLHVFVLRCADLELKELVDALLRTFFAREQFVARADRLTFAVVSVGRTLEEAQGLTARVHSLFQDQPAGGGPLLAATASLVPPECGEEWWSRALETVSDAQCDKPALSAIPASFDTR